MKFMIFAFFAVMVLVTVHASVIAGPALLGAGIAPLGGIAVAPAIGVASTLGVARVGIATPLIGTKILG